MTTRFFPSVLKFFTGNVLLTGVNVIRDMSIAAAFGAAATDHFFLASALLIFVVTVASGVCRSVHVPVLLRVLNQGETNYREVARRLIAVTVRSVGAGVVSFGVLAYVGMQVASFAHDESLVRTAQMLLFILPMYACTAFVEVCQGTLQTRHYILFPSMMRLGAPLGMVAGAVAGAPYLGVNALAVGGFIGGAIAAAAVAYVLWKEGLWAISAPKVPETVGKALRAGLLALTISGSIAVINPVVDLWMAGLLGPGAASKLGYASRLTVGIASLLVGSFAPVFLHQFSRLHAADNTAGLRSVYSHFFAFAPWLGACMTLGTWLLSGVVAPLLYHRGKFSAADVQGVVGIIDAYGLQFPFFLTSTVGFTLISALAKTHIFIRLNTILLLSNLVADVTLMRYLGLQGLALATSIVYAISLLSLNTYLWKEGTVRPDTHSVTGAVLALASLTMALVLVRLFDMKLTPSSGVMAYVKGLVLLGTVVAAGLLYNWQRIMTYWRARQSI